MAPQVAQRTCGPLGGASASSPSRRRVCGSGRLPSAIALTDPRLTPIRRAIPRCDRLPTLRSRLISSTTCAESIIPPPLRPDPVPAKNPRIPARALPRGRPGRKHRGVHLRATWVQARPIRPTGRWFQGPSATTRRVGSISSQKVRSPWKAPISSCESCPAGRPQRWANSLGNANTAHASTNCTSVQPPFWSLCVPFMLSGVEHCERMPQHPLHWRTSTLARLLGRILAHYDPRATSAFGGRTALESCSAEMLNQFALRLLDLAALMREMGNRSRARSHPVSTIVQDLPLLLEPTVARVAQALARTLQAGAHSSR